MSPLATTIILLLTGRMVAGQAFIYPYNGAQSYDETLLPGLCAGAFNGVNTDFICTCATSENYSAFISCTPATSVAIEAYCSSQVPTGTCLINVCPGGTCAPLELIGTVVPEETCSSTKNLGYKIGKGCGCYDDTSGRYTACQGIANSLVCISEQIYLDGRGTGGTSYLCESAPSQVVEIISSSSTNSATRAASSSAKSSTKPASSSLQTTAKVSTSTAKATTSSAKTSTTTPGKTSLKTSTAVASSTAKSTSKVTSSTTNMTAKMSSSTANSTATVSSSTAKPTTKPGSSTTQSTSHWTTTAKKFRG